MQPVDTTGARQVHTGDCGGTVIHNTGPVAREAIVVAAEFPERDSGTRYREVNIGTRRTAGAVVGALGALVVTASAYLDWYADQMPTDIPLERLFQTEVSGDASSYWTSVAAPLALAGVVGVIGMLLRSRLLLSVAGLIGLATLVLWIVMTAIDLSPEDLDAADYQPGVWVCAAGLVILLIGIVGMGRRYREVIPTEPADYDRAPRDYDDETRRRTTDL